VIELGPVGIYAAAVAWGSVAAVGARLAELELKSRSKVVEE